VPLGADAVAVEDEGFFVGRQRCHTLAASATSGFAVAAVWPAWTASATSAATGERSGEPTVLVAPPLVRRVRRHRPVLEADSDKVIYEALFRYPKKLRRKLFERREQELTLQRGLRRPPERESC
jgi:hypothetical protein